MVWITVKWGNKKYKHRFFSTGPWFDGITVTPLVLKGNNNSNCSGTWAASRWGTEIAVEGSTIDDRARCSTLCLLWALRPNHPCQTIDLYARPGLEGGTMARCWYPAPALALPQPFLFSAVLAINRSYLASNRWAGYKKIVSFGRNLRFPTREN